MDDIGSIGGLDKAGQGGGSYGGYYHHNPKKQTSQTPLRLKPGEILLGRIVELKDDDIVEVKLPMGNFRAILHGKLIRGDVLFLQVVEVTPSLLLKIHSVSSTFNSNLRNADEVIRILDIPQSEQNAKIVEYLLNRKSTILRSEVLQFAAIYAQFPINPAFNNPKPLFDAIFSIIISNEQDNIQLLKTIFPSFLPINSIYALFEPFFQNVEIKKIIDNEQFIDITSQLGIIANINKNKPNLLYSLELGKNVIAFNHSLIEYNRFAVAKNQPFRWFFGLLKSNLFVVFKIELLIEKKGAYGTADESAVSRFILDVQNNADKYLLVDFDLDYSERGILEKSFAIVSDNTSKLAQSYGLLLTTFEAYTTSFGLIEISQGNLKATPRNFSIVV